jgi:hypothetical protein
VENYSNSDPADPAPISAEAVIPQSPVRSKWIGWSSFFFAAVQSVCTAFVALSGIRILIGAAAFGSALGLLKIADQLHFRAIRIPMMVIALMGSLFNLAAILQVRRLRGRSASAWRQKPLSSKKINSERLQLALSILTLILLVLEYYFHGKLDKG